MKFPKKIFIIVALVGVFGATVYLNYLLNNKENESINKTDSTFEAYEEEGIELEAAQLSNAAASQGNYFETFSQDRDNVRKKEIEYLDQIVSDTTTDKETIKQAKEQKLEIAKAMDKEVIIEGLIKAKGFDNAIVTIQKGSVNIVIEGKELTSAQVAQILDIAKKESGEKAENIKIVPKV